MKPIPEVCKGMVLWFRRAWIECLFSALGIVALVIVALRSRCYEDHLLLLWGAYCALTLICVSFSRSCWIWIIASRKDQAESPVRENSAGLSLDRFQDIMALCEQAQRKLESRRTLEWKWKFGLWAGIAVVTGFGLGIAPQYRTEAIARLSVFILFLALNIFDFFWTAYIQRSHKLDQQFHLYYKHLAERSLGIQGQTCHYPTDDEIQAGSFGYLSQFIWITLLWTPTFLLGMGAFLALGSGVST